MRRVEIRQTEKGFVVEQRRRVMMYGGSDGDRVIEAIRRGDGIAIAEGGGTKMLDLESREWTAANLDEALSIARKVMSDAETGE